MYCSLDFVKRLSLAVLSHEINPDELQQSTDLSSEGKISLPTPP